MNTHRYRVIFNKALGVMTAVSELARSNMPSRNHKSQTSTELQPTFFSLKKLIWLTSLVFGNIIWISYVDANIVADPSAPGNQKPIIIESANGTPQVNIQTPNSSGLSHNKFSRFDVDERGVILNNSRKPTQTELGGMINGNQMLTGGEARIILNEVNSKNPSQLNGYIEVAGKNAQVIIANPAGVTCDGCGFINSQRATITTGGVNVENGAITGYHVNDGKIVIQGKGLDSSRQDRTDLIARAVDVNAGIWANDLAVTTGLNDVDANNDVITKTNTQSDDKPTVAIDVSDLGGMYAGKIRLVGTEKGVGIENRGEIGASAGNVVITADCKLINKGSIQSRADINIAANNNSSIENSGKMFADSKITLAADSIVNTGKIESRQNTTIKAKMLSNTGEIHSSSQLAINAQSVLNEGTIYADNNIDIASANLNNKGLIKTESDLKLIGDSFENTKTIVAKNTITIESQSKVKNSGEIAAGKNVIIKTQALETEGEINSEGNIDITVMNDYQHKGKIIANNTLTLNSAGLIDNLGTFWAAQQANLTALSFNNHVYGDITAGWVNMTTTNNITNRGLIDGITTTLSTKELNNIGTGRISGDLVAIQALSIKNVNEDEYNAQIAARQQLNIGTQTLLNNWKSKIYSGGSLNIGGTLTDDYNISGSAKLIENRSAKIESLNDMSIFTESLINLNDKLVIEREEITRTIETYPALASTFGANPNEGDEDESFKLSPFNTQNNTYLKVIEEDVVKETNPGEFIIGGNFIITADTLENFNSHILGANEFLAQIGELRNKETEGIRRITEIPLDTNSPARFSHIADDEQGANSSSALSEQNYTEEKIDLDLNRFNTNQLLTHSPSIPESSAGDIQTVLPSLPPISQGNFIVNPGNKSEYKTETNRNFTDKDSWLSSNYMQMTFNTGHDAQHKRFDISNEIKQVLNDQLFNLTGMYYVDGTMIDESQYKSLVAAGKVFTEKLDIAPGVALSAEQVELLNEDIILTVNQTVTQTDGTTRVISVPQLYPKIGNLELSSDGILYENKSSGINSSGLIR